jgi:NAD(P)-dependent dehydrogenase (short-subunit alcohol dehydrogenase family)
VPDATDEVAGTDRFSLAGRVALVTGASRGIGEAIARCFAAAGADVALVARSETELDRVAGAIRDGGRRALAIPCDVTDSARVGTAVEEAIEQLGDVDVLVNNAGGPVFNSSFLDMRESGWHKVLDLNLTSVVRFSQHVGRHMTARGHGSVINITSPAVLRPWPAITAYSAAKAAVLNLSQALAQEWAAQHVRVNAVSPGWIRTEINRTFTENETAEAATANDVPLGRWGVPDDVCGAALWLASDASSYVTGAHIAIDGGLTVAVPEDWRALRVERTWATAGPSQSAQQQP